MDGLTEHIIVVQWQRCEYFAEDPSTCASWEEYNKFFGDTIVTLEISNDFIKFSEPDTMKAIDGRLTPTLITDTA